MLYLCKIWYVLGLSIWNCDQAKRLTRKVTPYDILPFQIQKVKSVIKYFLYINFLQCRSGFEYAVIDNTNRKERKKLQFLFTTQGR